MSNIRAVIFYAKPAPQIHGLSHEVYRASRSPMLHDALCYPAWCLLAAHARRGKKALLPGSISTPGVILLRMFK